MGDFEAPSFSLGFDFDFDDTPEPQTTPNNTSNRDSVAADVKSVVDGNGNDNDKEFVIETLTVADSDEDNEVRPRLKRLRRGCSVEDRGLSGSATVDLGSVVVDDDDIEVFSSPEDNNAKDEDNEVEERPRLKRLRRGCSSGMVDLDLGSGKSRVDLGSVVVDADDIEDFSSPEDNNAKDETLRTQHYSVSNSSKFPLTGLGVLTRESGKRKQNLSNAPESVITSCSKQPFPKLMVSPLRMFQLIDSDSDSDIPSISKVATNKTCRKSESNLDMGKSVGLHQPIKLSESLDTSARKDLWEDFRHEKRFHYPDTCTG